MEKVLYHGSARILERPIFGEGNPRNDYGLGFYCTESQDLAREWASAETVDGFANQYAIDLSGLSVLNLNGPEFNILNWLAVLTPPSLRDEGLVSCLAWRAKPSPLSRLHRRLVSSFRAPHQSL